MTFKSLHGKPNFFFPDLLKRWSFQNNRAGIWYFLYYWERSSFFFPKTWSYTLDGKWGHDISCFIWKDDIVFLNTRYFILRQETRDGLSQEIHGNMIFSVVTCGCYKRGVTPLCQKKKKKKKNQRWSYPAKIHLRVVDLLDWRFEIRTSLMVDTCYKENQRKQ